MQNEDQETTAKLSFVLEQARSALLNLLRALLFLDPQLSFAELLTRSAHPRPTSDSVIEHLRRERRISPGVTPGYDVLVQLRSVRQVDPAPSSSSVSLTWLRPQCTSLRLTWRGSSANDRLLRLPPLLPVTVNGLPAPTPSPDQPPAKRRDTSPVEGDVKSSAKDLTLELGRTVGGGSAGTVYRGKVGGTSVIVKEVHELGGLEAEMENYVKLELALGREGEDGLEPLTPVVAGRFRTITEVQEVIIMEDCGDAMRDYLSWTDDQKCVERGTFWLDSLDDRVTDVSLRRSQVSRLAPPRAAPPRGPAARRRRRAQLCPLTRRHPPPRRPPARAGPRLRRPRLRRDRRVQALDGHGVMELSAV